MDASQTFLRGATSRDATPHGGLPPVIFVHGVGARPSFFKPMRHHLERRRGLKTHALSMTARDVEASAAELLTFVQSMRAKGVDRVNVVGHSMGGLIARWMVQEMEGTALVDTLVTLATPHHGTRAAYLSPIARIRALRPGSPLLRQLNSTDPRELSTRLVSVFGDVDVMVVPSNSARLSGGENIQLQRLTHNGYFVSRRVWRLLGDLLAARRHLDQELIPHRTELYVEAVYRHRPCVRARAPAGRAPS